MDRKIAFLGKETEPFDIWTASSLGNLVWLQKNLPHEAKDSVNRKNRSSWTPLMYASYYGYTSIVSFLIENGASVRCVSRSNKTPLMLSSMGGSDSCVSLLLQHGADVNDVDSVGWTSLLYAATYGYLNIVQIIITHGADVNHQSDTVGVTALMLASESGYLDIVRVLLDAGADTQLLSESKQSALSLACNESIATLLESRNSSNSGIHCGPKKVHELIRSPPRKEKSPISSQTITCILQDLGAILHAAGLGEYLPLFEQNDIDVSRFVDLTADDLKTLGVFKIGPRSRLVALIKKLKAEHQAHNSVMEKSTIMKSRSAGLIPNDKIDVLAHPDTRTQSSEALTDDLGGLPKIMDI